MLQGMALTMRLQQCPTRREGGQSSKAVSICCHHVFFLHAVDSPAIVLLWIFMGLVWAQHAFQTRKPLPL